MSDVLLQNAFKNNVGLRARLDNVTYPVANFTSPSFTGVEAGGFRCTKAAASSMTPEPEDTNTHPARKTVLGKR